MNSTGSIGSNTKQAGKTFHSISGNAKNESVEFLKNMLLFTRGEWIVRPSSDVHFSLFTGSKNAAGLPVEPTPPT
jgi:hypothetical protein